MPGPSMALPAFVRSRWPDLMIWGTAASVVLAGIVIVGISGERLRYPDEQQYVAIATNLIDSGVYSRDGETATAYRAPAYPLLLTVIELTGAGIVGMKFANFLLLAASIVLLGKVLQREVGAETGALGALLALGYPILLYAASTLFPQVLGGFLLLASFSLLLGRRSARDRVAAAVLYGALILTIPTFVALLPLMAALVYERSEPRRSLVAATLFVLVAGAVVAPWTLRNWVSLGEFVPLTTNSGFVLIKGNSDNTRPALGANVDISAYEAQAAGLDEVSKDRFYRRAARRWIQDNPAKAFTLYWQKVLNHFHFRNRLVVAAEASTAYDLVLLLSYYPLLFCAATRIALFRRIPLTKWEIGAAAMYVAFALASAVFFTRIRYRIPLDLLLIMLAASGVSECWRLIQRRFAAR